MLHINQWKSSASVIEWFMKKEDKKNCMFIKFDVIEFYPSITVCQGKKHREKLRKGLGLGLGTGGVGGGGVGDFFLEPHYRNHSR